MNIPLDKQLHIVGGFIISIFIGLFNPFLGFFAATFIGILKEVIYDHLMKKGCFEVKDMVATSFGGLIATLFLLII